MSVKHPFWISPSVTWPAIVKGLACLRDMRISHLATLAGLSPSQLSNWMAQRCSISPSAEARVVDALDLSPSLVAELGCSAGEDQDDTAALAWEPPETPEIVQGNSPPTPCRLMCDRLTLVLEASNSADLEDLVRDALAEANAEPLDRNDRRPYYRHRAAVGDLLVEWAPGLGNAAPVRLDLRPSAGPLEFGLVGRLVKTPWVRNRITRVDVAADYALDSGALELVGVRTRLGRVDTTTTGPILWSVSYLVDGEHPLSALRSSRLGSPRGSTVRLYAHNGERGWARVEAQRRLRPKRGRLTVEALGSLQDPFRATRIVVLDLPGLDWEDRLIVHAMRRMGATYVKRQMGAGFAAFANRLPNLETTGLPCPSTLFAERWPSVAQGWLSALGLAVCPVPAGSGEADP